MPRAINITGFREDLDCIIAEARVLFEVFAPRRVLTRCHVAVGLFGRAVFPSSPRRA